MERLKAERRWCIWKRELRNENWTKVPYYDLVSRARSNDPEHWIDYNTAEQLYSNNQATVAGIGLFLSPFEEKPELSLCGIDVDAHHTDGEHNVYAEDVLSLFSDTYEETSPSGNGYHILCYVNVAELNKAGFDKSKYLMKNSEKELEIYVGAYTHRYLTYTGNTVSPASDITDQTENVLSFLNQYMIRETRHDPHVISTPVSTENIEIQERLNLARRSKNGSKFSQLYDQGNISAYNNDHSAADMALVGMLCYWLNNDSGLIDEAFRASALYRDKWDELRGNRTYGEMTIQKAVNDCQNIYIPVQLGNGRLQWQGELVPESIDISEQNIVQDESLDNRIISPTDVLEMINVVESDVSNRDRITVLPIMCGTGKSTAIGLKMRQIIEANDGSGMIVITDSINRMRDYLLPKDPELKAFFLDYGQLVTVMTHDTLQDDTIKQRLCPILIMTTQRFVGLSHAQIESYLKWNGGERTTIIVDEQPCLLKQVDISAEDIDKICSAIRMGIAAVGEGAQDREELLDFWDHSLKDYLNGSLDYCLRGRATPGKQYHYYYRPNWQDDALFDGILAKMKRYKKELNSYSGDFVDIWTKVVAIRQLFHEGAILHWREQQGKIAPKFSLLLRNFEKFTDLDAKVIILDGTADISTSYKIYARDLDIRDCSRFERSLRNLHITIVDMATGKSSIATDTEIMNQTVENIRGHLEQLIPENTEYALFSYKAMKSQFGQYYDDKHFDWFGNIKGKNDYRDMKCIVQVGLNRFPDESYFLYELESNPDLFTAMSSLDFKDTSDVIAEHIEAQDGFTQEAKVSELLADFEQNMFRGTIRQSQSNVEYNYILFASARENKALIEAIRRRYARLGATVRVIPRPMANRVSTLMNRAGGQSVAKKIVIWHDTQIAIGTTYTYTDMANGINESKDKIVDACREKNNQVLNELLNKERISLRPATFKKWKNWQ